MVFGLVVKTFGHKMPVIKNSGIPINSNEEIIYKESFIMRSSQRSTNSVSQRATRIQPKLNRVMNLVYQQYENSLKNITGLKSVIGLKNTSKLNNIGIILK